MTDIERYQPPSSDVVARSDLDGWVKVMKDVCQLAGYISDTAFVPDSLRGNPAAVAAAILTGREMGVAPMTALANVHVIKGRPGQSALLMRGMVLAAGHEIRDVETTDTRCVIEGRRRGHDAWTRVMYTTDQAKRAGIDLGKYPQDKLYARATTRLCRRMFADIIAGLAYTVDELEDLPEHASIPPEQAPEIDPPKRRAKRNTPVKQQQTPAAPSTPEPENPTPDGPPLPGEDDPAPDTPDHTDTDDQAAVTPAQLARLHAWFTNHDIGNRDVKLHIARALTGRTDLTSSTDLTMREASQLIDALAELDTHASNEDFAAAIELLAADLGAVVTDDTEDTAALRCLPGVTGTDNHPDTQETP